MRVLMDDAGLWKKGAKFSLAGGCAPARARSGAFCRLLQCGVLWMISDIRGLGSGSHGVGDGPRYCQCGNACQPVLVWGTEGLWTQSLACLLVGLWHAEWRMSDRMCGWKA